MKYPSDVFAAASEGSMEDDDGDSQDHVFNEVWAAVQEDIEQAVLEGGSPSGTDNVNALQQDALEVLGEEQDDE